MRTIGLLGLLLAVTQQSSDVVVKGRVIDDLAQPVDNAWVEVTSRVTGQTASVRTDSNGDYVVRGIDVTTQVTIRVRRIGFRPALITPTELGDDCTVIGNVQLLPVAPMVIL